MGPGPGPVPCQWIAGPAVGATTCSEEVSALEGRGGAPGTGPAPAHPRDPSREGRVRRPALGAAHMAPHLRPGRGARRRGSFTAKTGIRPGRVRGPALRASAHIKAVPADTSAGTAAVGQHLGDGQADSTHPAGLDSGPRSRESQVLVVSHGQLTSGSQGPAIPMQLRPTSATPVSRLARQPFPAVWHASRPVGHFFRGYPARRAGEPRLAVSA
jgi:hypothetical protein